MSEVVFNGDALAGMISRLDVATQVQDFESLLAEAACVVDRIVRDKTVSGRILDSETLDAVVQGVGRRLNKIRRSAPNGGTHPRPRRVYLATELYMFGGHSRMLEDFVRAVPESEHLVIVSNCFNTGGGAVQAHEKLRTLGAEVVVLENGLSLVARTLRLMELLGQFPADACILFNHHQDVSIVAACQPEFCRNFFFYHHADHNLCLGARVRHFRHIDLTTPQFRRCEVWQAENIYLPISCEDKALRWDPTQRRGNPLITATAGSWVKFASRYHVDFADFLCVTLAQTGGSHIHFGDVPSEVLAALWKALEGKGIEHSRFEHVPWVPSLWEGVINKQVDVYLSSFPVGGARAVIEMMGAGVPIIFHANPSPYFVAERLRYEGAACWTYFDQLAGALADYQSAEALGGHSARARAHYERYFSDAVFKQAVKELGGSRNIDILPPLRPFYQDGARLYLEGGVGQNGCVSVVPPAHQKVASVAKFTVDKWLAARSVNPVQTALMTARLETAGRISLCVLLIDREADQEAWKITCESLVQAHEYGLDISVVHLGETGPIEVVPGLVYEYVDIEQDLASTLNTGLQRTNAQWFVLAQCGVEFTHSGFITLACDLPGAENCLAIYADEIVRNGAESGALFRPDFNLDLLLSLPAATARHWLFRREACLQLGGFDAEYPQALEFDFIVRLIEERGIGVIGHIAEPLVLSQGGSLHSNADEMRVLGRHLQRRGYPNGKVLSELPGRYRLIYGHEKKPLVSIIVPTKDQLPLLLRCITSLLEKTRYPNFEVLIVDNNSETPEAREWLDGVGKMGNSKVRVLRYPQPFNYSAINNMAACEARGEYLLLLNNDTAILREDWLDALMNHGQRPEVGIVGAKLLYPDGKIQHAGVILGLRGPADHHFIGREGDDPGYMQRMQVDQSLSVVTAACMLIRKSIYEQVGGLDEEAFKVSYNDVDLCLKVQQAGYLTVWTPHSVVMHVGSVSQTNVDPAKAEAKRKRFMAEQDAMYDKWLPVIARDPAYNPNLSLIGNGFELEENVDLTWKPLSWCPLPVVLAHMADKSGCGQYRVIQPFNAAKGAGLIDGALSGRLLSIPEVERFNPDSIVLQRQLMEHQLEILARTKKFSRAFKVYELDDYIPNLPVKSVHRAAMPKDVVKSLRKALSYVDRFVVSTEPLAEAFAGMHGEIRVVKNSLDPLWWNGLSSERRASSKPRVGWAGGSSHTGDLEMIADVVKELANEVEWVFFGMCPDKLRPYVHEFHPGIDIDKYPAALARLNLDLAVAPVEENLFNECKSNLRLLEYGACGFPVVCSDLVCYQGDLPVTRVRNRFKDWVDAIRMHLADMDATAKMGDALRAAVHKDWMLRDENLEAWRNAWLP